MKIMMVVRRVLVLLLILSCSILPIILAWTGLPTPHPPQSSSSLSSSSSVSSFQQSPPLSSSVLLLQDLERVVQRRPRISAIEQSDRDVTRRKFVTIDNDDDGCERGILMLEKWRRKNHHASAAAAENNKNVGTSNNHQTTTTTTNSNSSSSALSSWLEKAYEVCGCALVENRWRAQWKVTSPAPPNNKPSSIAVAGATTKGEQMMMIINTADQLLILYEWIKADGMVPSVAFLEAVLAGVASCSSPRHLQSRGYGSIVHDIWQNELQYYQEQQQQQQQEQPQSSETTTSTLLPASLAFHVVRGYCWQQANHGEDDCARAADDIYRQYLRGNVLYDAPARRLLTEAWSKATQGAERCQEIYNSFLVLDNNNNNNNNNIGGTDGDDNAAAAAAAMAAMPQDVMINTVLAWSKQPGGAERAEELLLASLHNSSNQQQKKQQLQQPQPQPQQQQQAATSDEEHHNDDDNNTNNNNINPRRVHLLGAQAVVTAWSRDGRPDRAQALLPYCGTTQCTNSVLHGWLAWADKDWALQRIVTIISTMAAPNAFTYATLIKAYRQANPSALHAPAAVAAWRQLVGLRTGGGDTSIRTDPVVNTNICLNVCARAANGVLARQVLRDHIARLPYHPPDTISYTTVLQAIANDKTTDDDDDDDDSCFSEDVIVQLFEQCPEPNDRTYAMAILALANHNGSPKTAYEILLRGHPHKNSYPYNYVLKCCNNYIPKSHNHRRNDDVNEDDDDNMVLDRFRIAARTFKIIPTPDSYSYSTWLRCIQNLIPDNDEANLRERCLRHAAAGAKKHGCWDHVMVQSRFAQCCPQKLREELMSR
jgi:hypothetical protein